MAMIFLSYSREDLATMHRIEQALQQAGATVWTDEDLTPGTSNWTKAIDKSLKECDAVVALLSPTAYHSKWVDSECGKAAAYGKEIFPILIEGDPRDAVPLSMWGIQRIDVRKNFNAGIEELITALQLRDNDNPTEDPPPDDLEPEDKPTQSMIWLLAVIILVVLLGAWGIYKIIDGKGLSDPVVVQSVPVEAPVETNVPTVSDLVNSTPSKAPEAIDIDPATVTPEVISQPVPDLGLGSTRVADTDGMELVYVPEGMFTMGGNGGEEDEKPEHVVYLDAFWIDKFEVTNEQYAQCTATGRCEVPEDTEYFNSSLFDNHPVVNVTYPQAQDYCKWAGRRLPTEAEWEKAARGTDGRLYPWGDEFDSAFVNADDEIAEDEFKVDCSHNGCDGYMKTSPIGQFPKGESPYGALDMAGNVWEWTSDWYDAKYYDESPEKNPFGPSSGSQRVLRGGSWYAGEDLLRVVNRGFGFPAVQGFDLGFRCAISAEEME
jgi:formylglycine-generating enzyme required for sulfatase activity